MCISNPLNKVKIRSLAQPSTGAGYSGTRRAGGPSAAHNALGMARKRRLGTLCGRIPRRSLRSDSAISLLGADHRLGQGPVHDVALRVAPADLPQIETTSSNNSTASSCVTPVKSSETRDPSECRRCGRDRRLRHRWPPCRACRQASLTRACSRAQLSHRCVDVGDTGCFQMAWPSIKLARPSGPRFRSQARRGAIRVQTRW